MLLVVRHAEAVVRVVGGPSEALRPLTNRGREQASDLVDLLVRHGPSRIVSSPYARALETVRPTADALGLAVEPDWDVREWNDGLETTPDWGPLYDRCWNDVECHYGFGESHAELTVRASTVLRHLLTWSGTGCVVVASHGTWIARGLEGLGVVNPYEVWRNMPAPAVYEIVVAASTIAVTGPGLPH